MEQNIVGGNICHWALFKFIPNRCILASAIFTLHDMNGFRIVTSYLSPFPLVRISPALHMALLSTPFPFPIRRAFPSLLGTLRRNLAWPPFTCPDLQIQGSRADILCGFPRGGKPVTPRASAVNIINSYRVWGLRCVIHLDWSHRGGTGQEHPRHHIGHILVTAILGWENASCVARPICNDVMPTDKID